MDQQQYSPNYPYGEPEKKNSWQAILALVLGILSILTSCGGIGLIFGILAIVFAVLDKKNNGEGNKLASAGKITGIIGTSLSVIAGIIGLILLFSTMVATRDIVSNNTLDNDYDYDYDWEDEFDDGWYVTDVPSTEDRTEERDTEDETTDDGLIIDWFTEGAFMLGEDTNSYTPAYELKRVGNSDVGYTYVPADYMNFLEAGGTGFDYSDQYSSFSYDIVGLNADDSIHAMAMAQSYAYFISEGDFGGNDPDTSVYSKETFGGYEGYAIKTYFPAENMWLYIFVFDDENDRGHYISVEFHEDGEYTDLWKTVFYNFSMTE